MLFSIQHTILALSALLGVRGQLIYRAEPFTEWDARIQSVRGGNGVFLSPNDDVAAASSTLGHVYAFDASSGSQLWSFTPNTTANEFLSCTSGITFSDTDSIEYVVYAVLINELSPSPLTRVIAVSMLDGTELWASENLDGIASGTPVASADGNYVFLTHNSEGGNVGHFTILDGLSGDEYHTERNDAAPFAPIGIHHAPAEGYYDGGEFNRNDILVWSVAPKLEDTSVGPGATFAFQFPIGFPESTDDIGINPLGTDVRDFQAIQKPVFSNDGRSMYWGSSRSQFRCWVGVEGFKRFYFSRPRTANVGFSRGSPAYQAVFAPLALSHNATELYLFGGTAANEFVRLNFDFSNEVLIGTSALVRTEARVSPDNAYVYYVEFNGHVHQASTEDLMDSWVFDARVPVEGEFAMTKDGTIIYIADVTGLIQALRVADPPTGAPSTTPSGVPSTAPSASPTRITSSPSSAPSSATSVMTIAPTLAPVATPRPTDMPINIESIDKIDSNDQGSTGGKSASASIRAATVSVLLLLPGLLM